jgi:serine/threonine protein kinase
LWEDPQKTRSKKDDIFALGVLLTEALLGYVPHENKAYSAEEKQWTMSADKLTRQMRRYQHDSYYDGFDVRTAEDRQLLDWIKTMLNVNPSDRHLPRPEQAGALSPVVTAAIPPPVLQTNLDPWRLATATSWGAPVQIKSAKNTKRRGRESIAESIAKPTIALILPRVQALLEKETQSTSDAIKLREWIHNLQTLIDELDDDDIRANVRDTIQRAQHRIAERTRELDEALQTARARATMQRATTTRTTTAALKEDRRKDRRKAYQNMLMQCKQQIAQILIDADADEEEVRALIDDWYPTIVDHYMRPFWKEAGERVTCDDFVQFLEPRVIALAHVTGILVNIF